SACSVSRCCDCQLCHKVREVSSDKDSKKCSRRNSAACTSLRANVRPRQKPKAGISSNALNNPALAAKAKVGCNQKAKPKYSATMSKAHNQGAKNCRGKRSKRSMSATKRCMVAAVPVLF